MTLDVDHFRQHFLLFSVDIEPDKCASVPATKVCNDLIVRHDYRSNSALSSANRSRLLRLIHARIFMPCSSVKPIPCVAFSTALSVWSQTHEIRSSFSIHAFDAVRYSTPYFFGRNAPGLPYNFLRSVSLSNSNNKQPTYKSIHCTTRHLSTNSGISIWICPPAERRFGFCAAGRGFIRPPSHAL